MRAFLMTLYLVAAPAFAESGLTDIPTATDRFADTAGLLSAPSQLQLRSKLRSFGPSNNCQFYVLIVDSLQGEPIEELGARAVLAWGLVGPAFKRSVLIVVAANDHELRIQTREELALSDAVIAEAMDDILIPAFSRSDFHGGLVRVMDFLELRAAKVE